VSLFNHKDSKSTIFIEKVVYIEREDVGGRGV